MTRSHAEPRTLGSALTVALAVLCGSTGASLAAGGVYYVALTGNDSNPGTQSQPWRHIQKAADTLAAGDTVQIRAGTYRERVIPLNSGSDGTHYITYTAYAGETVTLDGTGIAVPTDEGLFYVLGKSYIRISGIRISRSAYAGILAENASYLIIEHNRTYNTYSSGIGVWNSDHVTIDSNEVEGACTGPWQEHITVANVDTFEVVNNRVHGLITGTNGKEGICIKDGSRNGTAHGNEVYQIRKNGIYIDAWDKHTYNIQVYGNRLRDIPAADGITLASEMGGLLENILVSNNVSYRNMIGISISNCCSATHPMNDLRIVNNTVYNNGLPNPWGGGIAVDNPDATNVVIRNNIISQNLSFQLVAPTGFSAADHNLIDGFRSYTDPPAVEIYGTDYVEGDPQFVNASSANFHLQATSPAIDTGDSLNAPADDFDGNLRPQDGDGDATAAFDIGAFEFSPLVSIDDVSVTEGNSGTITATFTVSLSRAGDFPTTIEYATANGTATAGSDYVAQSGTLSYAVGETSKTIGVVVNGDTAIEPNETFFVNLTNAVGGTIADGQGVGTIINDDPQPVQFSVAAFSVSESGPTANIVVMRTGVTTGVATVDYATAAGTATPGSDYVETAGTLTFTAGQTSAAFAVPILDDAVGENNETIGLALSNPTGGATLGTVRSAILTILENERVVQFSGPTVTVSEGVAAATITVKRSGLLTGSVSVDYATSDGTAKAGVDYQAQAGTLSFGPNVVSKAFTIPIVNDTLDEADETVLVRLRDPVDGAIGPQDSAVVTITDNDAGGIVQFSAATYTVAENKATATISVTRTSGTASGVTVAYATSDGTAHAAPDPDPDYIATTGILTFGSGQTTLSFAVPIVNDASTEGAETVSLTLSSPGGGATLGARSTAILTILDDEQTLEFALAAYSVSEGGTAIMTVKRTGVATGTATVHYTTTDGTAHGGPITDPTRDYTTTSGTLTFGPNVVSKTISIPTTNDTLNEANTTFNLTLDTANGATLGTLVTTIVTIADNDPAGLVQFGASTYSVGESVPSLTILVTRTGGTASGVVVAYDVTSGTAQEGVDFGLTEGTLTFAASQTSRTMVVPITNDTEAEGAETIGLTLTPVSGGAAIGPRATTTITINDNDSPQFQFSAATYSVAEATAKATITVKRVGTLSAPATVQYATSDGTASASADYAAAAGTLSFAANAAAKTFTVDIINDTLDEPNETVTLTLSAPSSGNGLGSPSTAVLTIVDNDAAGTVQFGAPAFSAIEGEEGTTDLATITVTRAGGAASGATVDYATSNGTATSGSDYTGTAGTLTFAAGVTSKTFTVEILGDAVAEGNETVNLTLQNPGSGLTLGALRVAKLWIVEPAGAAKLVFIHHSTGENWLNDTNGQLGKALRDNNYFVSDTNYGWGPDFGDGTTIGDHTDIGHWYEWFVGTSSATYLTALYDEFEQHSSYTRLSDPDPTRKNEIVVFKSCFPNSNLSGNPDDPATTDPNLLRGQDSSSPYMTVANAKGIYNDLLTYFAAHQEKLFVLVTSPPLASYDTSPEAAANARGLNHWLVNDWLTGYGHNNVAVLDFYNVLTTNGGTPAVNDLGKETGNHHRWWHGAIQHAHPVANDVSAYPTADSHPSAAGGKKATGELVTLLIYYYNVWKGLPVVPGAQPTNGVRGASQTSRTPAPDMLAPPGNRPPTARRSCPVS